MDCLVQWFISFRKNPFHCQLFQTHSSLETQWINKIKNSHQPMYNLNHPIILLLRKVRLG